MCLFLSVRIRSMSKSIRNHEEKTNEGNKHIKKIYKEYRQKKERQKEWKQRTERNKKKIRRKKLKHKKVWFALNMEKEKRNTRKKKDSTFIILRLIFFGCTTSKWCLHLLVQKPDIDQLTDAV